MRSSPPAQGAAAPADESLLERLRDILQVETLPVPRQFAAELLEACPVPFARLEDDDPSGWEVCELHHREGDEGVLRLRENVRSGAAGFEPLVSGPLIPDPRSGVFAVASPEEDGVRRFVVVSHGGRKPVSFKERIARIVDAQHACPRLYLGAPGQPGSAALEVHFEPVLPLACLYGWIGDFLVFPHAGAPVFALGAAPETAASLRGVLACILRSLDERGSVLPDVTPRNLVHALDGAVMRVGLCDLEHGAVAAEPGGLERYEGAWGDTLGKNALEYLFALRHAPPGPPHDPLSPDRLRVLYRSHPRVWYFEETLARFGLLQALGCGGIGELRGRLLATFFGSPAGMEAFFLLRGVWDRVPPASYVATLATLMAGSYDMVALAGALSTTLRVAAVVEYLHGLPEGIAFLRRQGLEFPSLEVCTRMLESYLAAAGQERGTDGRDRHWLETAPARLGFAPLMNPKG